MPTRLALLFAVCACGGTAWAQSVEGWQAGYAEADITPSEGRGHLAGYGRERHVEGTLHPLRAQVLALEDRNGRKALLVTADVLGFGRVSVDAMRYRLRDTHGIPPEAVCFAASHTHWGPGVNFRTNFYLGAVDVWYLAWLEETLLEIAGKALENLSPAAVSYGACDTQIGMCRRFPQKDGSLGWGPYPEGSYDTHTPILRVQRRQAPGQIIVAGHACHPTSTGRADMWSPDYPGAMRRVLESRLEDCRVLFVMGCGGDAKVVYRDNETGKYAFAASPEQSEAGGTKLAAAILDCLEDSDLHALDAELRTTLVRGALRFQPHPGREALEKMAFSGKHRAGETFWARQALAFPDGREAQRYDVQVWRLGALTITALEGEVCADWGGMVRSWAETDHAMAIGYANHVPGYIPTARIVQEGGYEGDTSHKVYFMPAPFTPNVENEVMGLVLRALGRDEGTGVLEAPLYEDKTRLLRYIDAHGKERPITSRGEWQLRRQHILANVRRVLGPVPGRAWRVPLELEVLETVERDTYTQKKIAYNTDPYDRVESYLLLPHGLKGKVPGILAAHGTNARGKDMPVGLYGDPSRFYARELAERGYVVIAPDYWPMGHYADKKDYDPHQKGYASAIMKGVWNHMRAIDVLQSLPEVDDTRIGSIGHSLGGYSTVFLGALEPRVRALVSSAGYCSFYDYAASEYGGGTLRNWSLDKHMRRLRTIYNDDPAQVPFDFPELIALIAPRPFLTIAPTKDHNFVLPGVVKCLDAARPVYRLLDASDDLRAEHPVAGHDFPEAARKKAYEFFDEAFSRNQARKGR